MIKSRILLGIAISLIPIALLGQTNTYIVKKGDTLYTIAQTYQISVSTLRLANHLNEKSGISIGQKLTIPAFYKVKKGDTYFSIAKNYQLSLKTLLELNNRTEKTKLIIGENIIVQNKSSILIEPQNKQDNSDSGLWPITGKRQDAPGKLDGIIIYGNNGDKVRAVYPGIVIWVGPYRGFGKVAFIESSNGYIYVYAGNHELWIKPGDNIQTGMEIGQLGTLISGTLPRCFFSVYKDGKPIDPNTAPRG